MENEKYNPITIGYLYDSDNCQSISIDVISKLDYVNYSFALIDNGRAYIRGCSIMLVWLWNWVINSCWFKEIYVYIVNTLALIWGLADGRCP